MIIGISGRIGSGKDTVGEIIQKLCLTNKGPEFEIKKNFAEGPADSDERWGQAIFGIVCAGGGLWILRASYGTPKP